jgi:hypothetical protein
MSLDLAVIDAGRLWEHGHLYTAVSRLRTYEGMFLRNFSAQSLRPTDELVVEWWKGQSGQPSICLAVEVGFECEDPFCFFAHSNPTSTARQIDGGSGSGTDTDTDTVSASGGARTAGGASAAGAGNTGITDANAVQTGAAGDTGGSGCQAGFFFFNCSFSLVFFLS